MDAIGFWTLCGSNGIIISREQMEQFERYANEMTYWNEKINLVSRQDIENLFEKHILHSISALKHIEIPRKAKCLDIGSGGGLPGIPLAIMNPEASFLLIDSIAKKIKTTDIFAKHTGLRFLKTAAMRAEKLTESPKERNSYDFIFSRAVARSEKLISWTKDALKKNGKYVFYKGGDLTEEIEEAQKAFPDMEFETIALSLRGADYLIEEEKKLLIGKYKQ